LPARCSRELPGLEKPGALPQHKEQAQDMILRLSVYGGLPAAYSRSAFLRTTIALRYETDSTSNQLTNRNVFIGILLFIEFSVHFLCVFACQFSQIQLF
jgi:hypothetical protein